MLFKCITWLDIMHNWTGQSLIHMSLVIKFFLSEIWRNFNWSLKVTCMLSSEIIKQTYVSYVKTTKILIAIHRVLNLSKIKLPPWWLLQMSLEPLIQSNQIITNNMFRDSNNMQKDFLHCYKFSKQILDFGTISFLAQVKPLILKNKYIHIQNLTNWKKQTINK